MKKNLLYAGLGIIIVTAIALAFCFLGAVMISSDSKVFVQRYVVVQETIREVNASGSDVERAALIETIISYNQQLDHYKQQKNTLLGFAVNKGVDTLQPLKLEEQR